MARFTNNSKSVVKLQALVRGYLVRKKFSRLKHEYNEIVKRLEGDSANVGWKTDVKLCLPVVFHGCLDTRERFNDLSDDVRQKYSDQTLELSSENGQNINSKYISSSASTENNHNESKNVCVADNTKNCTSKECLNIGIELDLSADENTGLVSVENTNNKNVTINDTVVTKGNVENTETDKTGIVDERNDPNEGSDSESTKTFYPKDKPSLLKLREDLTMELLWIEQAIDSRVNYLSMRENMDKQVQDH